MLITYYKVPVLYRKTINLEARDKHLNYAKIEKKKQNGFEMFVVHLTIKTIKFDLIKYIILKKIRHPINEIKNEHDF